MYFNIYPLMIGFAYLLSSEVSFSLWFLYLFYKLRAVALGALGIPMSGVGAGYGRYIWASLEESGGTIALAVWFARVARSHFVGVFRKAFTNDPSIDDSDEPLSEGLYAAARIGIGVVNRTHAIAIRIVHPKGR